MTDDTYTTGPSGTTEDENRETTPLSDSSLTRPPARKKKRPQSAGKFKYNWSLPSHICSSSKGSRFAYCKLCAKHFTVSHGGYNDVQRHVNGAVHQRKIRSCQGMANIGDVFRKEPSLLHSSRVISAEIMMVKFLVLHNLSFKAADHLSELFPMMFPDSAIAADFSCKRTKTKAIVSDALDPYMKKPVVEILKVSPFSLLCDESNDRGDSVKLLTILVRLYDPGNQIIVTRHLETVGITDLTADGIFSAIAQTLQKYNVPFSNLLSFVSDTCNVMKGVKGGVIAKIRSEQPKVVDINCICHLVSLVVKAATKTLPLKIDELLIDIYYHFHHSVKRVTSFKEFADFCTTEYRSILKHVETRWLSLTKVIQRTLHMWEPLCSYFTSHPDVEKPGKVKNISKLLNDPITKIWFHFLSYILAIFNKFNVFFQTAKTSTIHKLHGETLRLLKTVLSFFIDPLVVRTNSDDLTGIAYASSTNHLATQDMFIGDSTTALVLQHQDEGCNITVFYEGAIRFYIAAVKKVLKVYDFRSNILQTLSFLYPGKCQTVPQSTFDAIEEKFPIAFEKATVKLEHREFMLDSEEQPEENEDAVNFWLKISHLKSPMGEHKYHNLAFLALQLLSIPSSNADSERVFSLVRRIKTEFRSSLQTETLSALIGCHFNKTTDCCEKVHFDGPLLSKAKSCTHERNLRYPA